MKIYFAEWVNDLKPEFLVWEWNPNHRCTF